MEYHRVGMAYKVATGVVGDTTFNFTSSQAINSKWVGVAVFRQTGVTDWALDASSFAGSNTTNVSSIALGSTGTLSSATGVAVVAGTSRTGSEGLTTSVGTSLSGTDADFEVDAGSANFIAAWADLSATTALDATISESNGSSRMGAGIAVFVEAGGGSPSTGTGTGTIVLPVLRRGPSRTLVLPRARSVLLALRPARSRTWVPLRVRFRSLVLLPARLPVRSAADRAVHVFKRCVDDRVVLGVGCTYRHFVVGHNELCFVAVHFHDACQHPPDQSGHARPVR